MADAAAQAGVPLIRFAGPGVNGGQDSIDPLMERPDVIVESQRKTSGTDRPGHFLHTEILQLVPGASLSTHRKLASVIKVRQQSTAVTHGGPKPKVCIALAAPDTLHVRSSPDSAHLEGVCCSTWHVHNMRVGAGLNRLLNMRVFDAPAEAVQARHRVAGKAEGKGGRLCQPAGDGHSSQR